MISRFIPIIMLSAVMVFAGPAAAKEKILKEAPGAKRHKLGTTTVFEQKEGELGTAVAEVIRTMSNDKIDLTGRASELGDNVNTVVKTMLKTQGYDHELNDALVKAWLGQYQFAKNNGLLKEFVEAEARNQSPMLLRVKKMIEMTGNRELALMSVFEHTSCYFHLVHDTTIEPGKRTYKSPYSRVLNPSKRLGIFDLTVKEIHENITIPRMNAYGKLLGVTFNVSEWRDDGMITVTLAQ
jgi:hypothetical protein